jgi:hypothetical protein
MKSIFTEKKEAQKNLALLIRNGKKAISDAFRKRDPIADLRFDQPSILKMRSQYRHAHVAYCLARGRKMKEVENVSHSPLSRSAIESELTTYFSHDEVESMLSELASLGVFEKGGEK